MSTYTFYYPNTITNNNPTPSICGSNSILDYTGKIKVNGESGTPAIKAKCPKSHETGCNKHTFIPLDKDKQCTYDKINKPCTIDGIRGKCKKTSYHGVCAGECIINHDQDSHLDTKITDYEKNWINAAIPTPLHINTSNNTGYWTIGTKDPTANVICGPVCKDKCGSSIDC